MCFHSPEWDVPPAPHPYLPPPQPPPPAVTPCITLLLFPCQWPLSTHTDAATAHTRGPKWPKPAGPTRHRLVLSSRLPGALTSHPRMLMLFSSCSLTSVFPFASVASLLARPSFFPLPVLHFLCGGFVLLLCACKHTHAYTYTGKHAHTRSHTHDTLSPLLLHIPYISWDGVPQWPQNLPGSRDPGLQGPELQEGPYSTLATLGGVRGQEHFSMVGSWGSGQL